MTPPSSSLTDLISTHTQQLDTLYSSLTTTPAPQIASQLSSLESILRLEISKQTAEINRLLQTEREKLDKGWDKVNDWLAALGEPAQRRKEEGVLEEMVRDVERVLEGLRNRISERGQAVVKVQRDLYEVREIIGEGDVRVRLDAKEKLEGEKGWEELDLQGDRLAELETELDRCRNEIAQRREVINLLASDILTFFKELGSRLPSENQQEEDALLESVWLHLGVGGDDKQTEIELVPTKENVEKLQKTREALEREQLGRHETIQQIYDQLYHLWAMLGVQEEDMENFVNTWTGSTLEVIAAYQAELDRMLLVRRANLSAFINAEREALAALYDQLYLSHSERIARFPAYSISIESERVWRDDIKGGWEEELVNENVSEELLIRHEREREKVEVEVEDAKVVLEKLERYFEVVQKAKDLEAAASDPTRLTARGSSTKLLLEERDRKRVAKEKPKLEAELRGLIPVWESKHRRPFMVDGVPFLDSLDEQQRAEEMEKENKRRTKLGTTANAASSTRPLRPQATGTSTVAPLKRQMTGTSMRSTTSSNSSSAPPPAKRQVPMSTGSSANSSSYYSQPPPPSSARPRSVLGDYNSRMMATPASTKLGTGTRSRSNTVSKMVTPTLTGGSSGMRIPTGWGGNSGVGGVGLQPQMTGSRFAGGVGQKFRPRPSQQTR